MIATCRNPDAAEALQALAAKHPDLRIEALDVTRPEQISDLASKLKAREPAAAQTETVT